MSYADKLKDPRWQKKRLEVLQRDDFTCQRCGDKERTLHVHHKTYIFGNDPWDYPDTNLVTLCADCHEYEEYSKTDFQDCVKRLLNEGYTYEQLAKYVWSLLPPVEMNNEERVRYAGFCAQDLELLHYVRDKIVSLDSEDLGF